MLPTFRRIVDITAAPIAAAKPNGADSPPTFSLYPARLHFRLRWRKTQLGEIPTVLNCLAFDICRRFQPALLFQKKQERPRTDFAAIVRQQETGAGDLVIFKQEYAGRRWVKQREVVHRFLYGEFAEIRLPRGNSAGRLRAPVVLVRLRGHDVQLMRLDPCCDSLTGWRLVARDLMQRHVHDLYWPTRFEQHIECIGIGQGNKRSRIR